MKSRKISIGLFAVILVGLTSCKNNATSEDPEISGTAQTAEDWQLGPFIKVDSVNPILRPNPKASFIDPIRNTTIHWEAKDVFNPSAVTHNGKVMLIYRAEDSVGKYAGTSRIGLAESEDGLHFTRHPEPIFYPGEDEVKKFEWEGGTEDPRVVQDEDGTYYMTYSAWPGQNSYLSIASSPDLKTWTKHGPVFEEALGGKYLNTWSKSGAIVSRMEDGNMIAQKINGKYWMYWGDTDIFLATSEDLVNWTPVEAAPGDTVQVSNSQFKGLKPILSPRPGQFDSHLVEPGPAPIITADGIWMIYNSRNGGKNMNPDLPEGTYSAGQVLFDIDDPTRVIARSEEYFITPEKDYEVDGQVDRVCFVEGLVYFKDKWYLYYGTADSKIAVAVCTDESFLKKAQNPEL